LNEEKPEFIYEVIETLLPKANLSEENPEGDRLLELWAKPEHYRKGWTVLAQPNSSLN
jgi:hypothetical protein